MTQPPNSASPNVPKLPRISELGRDLIELGKVQLACTIVLPFALVTAYFAFAIGGYWPLAVITLAAYTFYSYGSISHDMVHGNLGLPRWLNHVLLSVVELLGVRSGHAYRAAHLHHHATFPHADDVEGAAAHGSFIGALMAGPLHQARIWWWACQNSHHDYGWILFEGAACISLVSAAVAMLQVTLIPIVYVALVILGSWTFPLITAYLPHQPHAATPFEQTRRFRGKVAAIIFQQHFYHLEHHLYPMVPHHRWPTLAARLDLFLDQAGAKAIRIWF